MALNIVNEKIYTVLWFWFVVLAVITGLGLVWRLLTMILHSRLLYLIFTYFSVVGVLRFCGFVNFHKVGSLIFFSGILVRWIYGYRTYALFAKVISMQKQYLKIISRDLLYFSQCRIIVYISSGKYLLLFLFMKYYLIAYSLQSIKCYIKWRVL